MTHNLDDLDVNDHEKIRDFEIGKHHIIVNYETLNNNYTTDVCISMKCIVCDFDCTITSTQREAAVYAWLQKKPCDKVSHKF